MIPPTREGCFITERRGLQNLLLSCYLHTTPYYFLGKNNRLFTDKPGSQLQTVQIKMNNDYTALIPVKGLFKVPGFQGINYIGEDGRRFSNT